MDFETFKDQFTEDVKQALYERDLDVKVSIHSIEKPNENYESMTVTPEGSNIGVNVNLNRFYDAYESGTPYDEVLSRAVDVTERGIQESPEVNVSELTDYNFMKDKLAMEVVSVDANADLLQNVPHHNIEDMAVIYRCVLSNEQEGMASIVVTNAMMDTFGVSQEQLHADALANAPEIKPAVITGMSEMMKQMMGEEEFAMFGMDIAPADEMMYVATVPDKIHGAGVIAYQDFMDQAAEKIGGDFYVLPSSIHEVLLVRDDGNADFHDLEAMVQEVNATQVSPEEKLTDNVYHYDSKDHVFELAEKFEERMKAKEAGIDEQTEERGSILADLKAKKQECAAKPHEVWGHMAEDDVFKYYSEAMEESLFKKGVIYYYAIVYWIDKKSKYYEIVDKWEEGAIAQAGILKASETFDVSKIIPVFERDVFEFSFDFRDESVIKEEMLKRGRNMFSSQKKYERDNYVCTYRDIFINNDKKALFEDIIVQLQEEFQNAIVCK